jgi:molybdopterin synthase catalytic subunit
MQSRRKTWPRQRGHGTQAGGERHFRISTNMIELVTTPIDTDAVLRHVSFPEAGAVVLFLGTTRRFTEGRETASLDYECFAEMARRKLDELEAEARRRWPLVGCAIVHRVGHLELGEASVAVAVSTPHRQAAFEAGKWLIDTLKKVVPIWKKENWTDGTSGWIHPGLEAERPIEAAE